MYNYYMIAENVATLHKYYYMARYSLLKTLAGKHRTYVSEIKKRYMKDGILKIPYVTKSGPKVCEFYHDGFRKQQTFGKILILIIVLLLMILKISSTEQLTILTIKHMR